MTFIINNKHYSMEWSWSSFEEAVSCGEVWCYPPQPPPYRQATGSHYTEHSGWMTCIHPPLKSRIHRIWFRQHCKRFLGLPLKSYITVLVLSHFLFSLDSQSLSVSIVMCPSMLICLFSIICHGANGSESWSASQLCGITQSRWWIYLTKTWYSSALFRAQGRLMF